MTNSLNVVAKIFSNTLIFLLQKYEQLLHAPRILAPKNVSVFAIFQRNFIITLANNFAKF